MVSIDHAGELALSFEEAVEQPHFEKTSFRVRKKIFATLDIEKRQVIVKLSEVGQSVFSDFGKNAIYPAQGGWERQGWTIIELDKVYEEMFRDALMISYINVAPQKLGDKYRLGSQDV